MTKIRAKIELKQTSNRYELSMYAPTLQKMIREIARESKYTEHGYIHFTSDKRLSDYFNPKSSLILANKKPNLLPLFLKNSKVNKMKIPFNKIQSDDLILFSKEINTRVVEFYSYLSKNKHKFNIEWIKKALDYYLEKGVYENRINYSDYTYYDLSNYLTSLKFEIKKMGVKPFD